jgi:beta-hydroxylase
MIPQRWDQCGIEVDGETYHWKNGESLIFDDTYQHRAWNQSDELRVVLFVDFLRPMPRLPDLLNRAMISLVRQSPLVKKARLNYAQWKSMNA